MTNPSKAEETQDRSPALSPLGALGWLAAAALGAVFFMSGFAQKGEKLGVVDMTQAFGKSSLKQKHEDKLRAMTESRKAVLDFIGLNPMFTADQVRRFRELSLKDKLTDAEKKEVEQIKTDVQNAVKDSESLRQKQSPTAEEVKKLDDYANRMSVSRQARQQFQEEFVQEMAGERDSEDNTAFLSVRDAVRDVGKNQNFSVIFSERAAVYGSTDVTDEVQKVADKKGS
jgi:Skp family chaperone for outer membrane proteins